MLESEGVDLRHVEICPVLADQLNQHVYLGIKDDHGLWPFPSDWHRVIAESRALYTDGYTLRDLLAPDDVFAAFASARAAGLPIFFDPGPSVEFLPDEHGQSIGDRINGYLQAELFGGFRPSNQFLKLLAHVFCFTYPYRPVMF